MKFPFVCTKILMHQQDVGELRQPQSDHSLDPGTVKAEGAAAGPIGGALGRVKIQ